MEITQLVGELLTGVCYIQDYVELYFDGPIIRCLANPILRTSKGDIVFPEVGSRDALCALIGQTIEKMNLNEDKELTIEFSTGKTLIIPLDAKHREGPEAMHFVPFTEGPIQIW
jgi:hypothetical protein